jgi:signal transduction histidine kinase
MKLISKTIIYYLLISLPLIVIAGILSYYFIKSELSEGMNESLLAEKIRAEKLITTFKVPQNVYLSSDSLSHIKIANKIDKITMFSNTSLYNQQLQEDIEYRILKTNFQYNNTNYAITISKTTFEDNELLEGLLSAFVLIVCFLVLSFFIVNWFISKTLWQPFYKTLSELNKYDLRKQAQQNFKSSNIKEFNQLNIALNKMKEKIQGDFLQQKEFTENAAHEMQTPVAILKANISLLLQSPHIKEEEMNHLQNMENTLKKLSALNKSLLILTKIENNQFPENLSVNLNETITKMLIQYEDLIVLKKLRLTTKLGIINDVIMNPSLAEILIANLIQNAIRHNIIDGEIIIISTENNISFSNSGEPLRIPKQELFTRFKKNDASQDSLGLGLSIVKSIATMYEIEINYDFNNNMHHFTLKFK